MADLSGLFAPSRVAVVGATDREGSIGRGLLENLSSFDGEVVPVNPNRERVLGRECYPSLSAVPEPTDLAVVVVPAGVAVDVVREAGETGVENVVVITSGFGETDEEGERREERLVEIATEYDLNLVGPNCLGIVSTPSDLNATFADAQPERGKVSFLSQSGAFVTALLDWATARGMGFRDVVSLGNEAVLGEVDFLEHWGEDPDTDVILGYLEDVEDGRRFVDVASEVTAETPVVVVKSGRTGAGAAAAASHTGSLAGSDEAYEAGFHQAGVIRADTAEELFDFAQVLAGQPLPDGDGVAVVSNAGGPGVMAADAIDESRLSLSAFADETVDALRAVLPAGASAENPLDIVGDATIERFREALQVVLAADEVDSVIAISAPTTIFEVQDLAEAIDDVGGEHDAPVLTCLMGGDDAEQAGRYLQRQGIQNYFDPARAVRSVEVLATYRDVRRREPAEPRTFDVDRERAGEILADAAGEGRTLIGVEGMALLAAYGVPTPPGEVAESADEATTIASEIGGPVAMKAVSPEISHKSDVGGVRLDVAPDRAGETYDAMLRDVREHHPDAPIRGVYVEEFVEHGEATEVIVGTNRDPQFGPLVMFGLGGVFVEILEDTAYRVAPVTAADARAMTEEIDSAPMLRGARGRTPADVDAVVEAIERVSRLVTDFPAIEELDVNPLLAGPDGVTAVDLRLVFDPDEL